MSIELEWIHDVNLTSPNPKRTFLALSCTFYTGKNVKLSSCTLPMRVTQSGHVKTGVDHMPYRGHTMFTYTGRA